MSARQGEWHLLGHDGDPVPATPWEIDRQGRHYKGVAEQLREQAARLRRLAEQGSALEGHYAEGLRHSSRELAGHLEQAEGRFDDTGEQLCAWADDVREARRATSAALGEAEEAHARVLANQPLAAAPGAEPPTPAQQVAADARADRLDTAEGELAGARQASNRALTELDRRADQVAAAIRRASDDDMKDSRWDRFKGKVERIAGVLSSIREILGYIAIALVVVSLFVPGLNLLVAALIVGLGMLAISSLLAATGNGSWLDVAFDVVGVATLGIGRVFTSLARVGRGLSLTRAAPIAGQRASAQVLRAASFNGGRGVLGRIHSWGLRTFPTSTRSAMHTARHDAYRTVLGRQLPDSTALQALRAGGDHTLAGMRLELRALTREFGPGVIHPSHLTGVSVATDALRANLAATGLSHLGSQGLVPGYRGLSDRMVEPIGGPF